MYPWELQGISVPQWKAAINALKTAKTLCHTPSRILARKLKEAEIPPSQSPDKNRTQEAAEMAGS